MEIAFGSDSNEELKDGQSATQFPREYSIETETTRYHLIDTPRIGDSRGIDQDKENFDNILAFLSCYDKINAVVVLLKPNSARLTILCVRTFDPPPQVSGDEHHLCLHKLQRNLLQTRRHPSGS